jgi:hypothetical protein
MEGTGPCWSEIRPSWRPSALGTPRRAVVGWDQNRLSMVLAVLEAHGGLRLGMHDVYLNVAGGLRITEPAADLAAAQRSSPRSPDGAPLRHGAISARWALGRHPPVAHAQARLKEAAKLGFSQAVGARRPAPTRASGMRSLRPVMPTSRLVAGIARDASRQAREGPETGRRRSRGVTQAFRRERLGASLARGDGPAWLPLYPPAPKNTGAVRPLLSQGTPHARFGSRSRRNRRRGDLRPARGRARLHPRGAGDRSLVAAGAAAGSCTRWCCRS